jgi:deferrochelatase/peroxidase EfeB
MPVSLDLSDIQGNILTAYGKAGFPKARYILFHVDQPAAGRNFVASLLPMITTALRWRSKRDNAPTGAVAVPRPEVTVNVAFTSGGLAALGVSPRTLNAMPDEFLEGMRSRAPMLGDALNDGALRSTWDQVWTAADPGDDDDPYAIHILVQLNAQMQGDGRPVAALDLKYQEIAELCDGGGVKMLLGHNPPGASPQPFQELSAILAPRPEGGVRPLMKEHFGFTDAISDPVFEGQYPDGHARDYATGNGAVDGKGRWRPLATGEFLLGYPDEAQEMPAAAMPNGFSRNGVFMAYRKLHQNISAFHAFIDENAPRFDAVFGIGDLEAARETLLAKIAGRWSDGVPLTLAPTYREWNAFNARYPDVSPDEDPAKWAIRNRAMSDFRYNKDKAGFGCPVASHLRRANTRDGMAPTAAQGSDLNNRRRILRRGLPYGDADTDEHGIVMLVHCASLFRQFEFVQQQWLNYGLDAGVGSDTCPMVGNHASGEGRAPKAKYVIPYGPGADRPPFIVEGIPQFVEVRGGEYFFVPSVSALGMIARGAVDPT